MPIRHLRQLDGFFPKRDGGNGPRISKKALKPALLWGATLGVALFLVGVLGTTIAFAWYSRDLPDPNTLMERNVPQSTKIYDRTGETLLYEIHGEEKRTLVKIEDIPDTVKWATVSIEDKNFYTHHGIDWKGLVRAVVKGVTRGRRIGGTSTLTQQFVKNAILTNERSLPRKLKEFVLAMQIERLYSKDQILQLYLNEIPYGSTIYGIESAARGYFGKSAKELTLDEAALLAALPQAPDRYSPYGTGSRGDNRVALVGRQHYVLDQMAAQGYLPKDQTEEAKKIDTLGKLVPKRIGDIKAPHFVTYVRSQLIEEYGQRTVEEGGFKVTTSLAWDMQQIAEEEVMKGVDLRGPRYKFTNGSLVAIDPKTGHILAMVGSKDFFDQENDGQVNVALRPRQPGSSFKPIVYAAGFLKGYTPEMTLWDVNTKFKTDLKDYEPKNYNLKENGPVSVRMALQGSLNIPAVKMLYLVGVGRVIDFAEELGYTTFADRSRFGLALVLGGGEVKLLEHTNAFATFANQGKQMPITSILKVEDAKGSTLHEWEEGTGRQVVDRDVALRISDVLSDNNARAFIFGARNFLTLPDRPVAAKTGTTNNYHDAWTMGYVPQLAAGVWIGNNDNTEMSRGADGSVIAAPIWQAFMTRALKGTAVEGFPKPPPSDTVKPILLGKSSETKVRVDRVSGKRATEFTPPELVEERTYREAHSELWYIDKDDPRGPAPTNPTADPQFANWESSVKIWAAREGWDAFSTPPTEDDDVHTEANRPQISLLSPSPNATWNTREPVISVSVSSARRITRVEATLDGTPIGASLDGSFSFNAKIPNSIGIGFHDLTVTATDDVGNRGSATTNVNLTAEAQAETAASVTSPSSGARIAVLSFPQTVQVLLSDLGNTQKVDLYLEESLTGDTRLIGTAISPQQNAISFSWTVPPTPGTYYLYAIVTKTDNIPHAGTKITVIVEAI